MKMKTLCLAILLAASATTAAAQDTAKVTAAPKPEDRTPAVTPLRVQVVFSEYDGEKKVSNLPYTFTVNAEERRSGPWSQMRNGVRVPISTSKDQITYMDIGTNVDCSASQQDDGRFRLQMRLERTSISSESSNSLSVTQPAVRQFRADINPVLKDGQTTEAIVSTDPLSGHSYHVSVTLNVIK